MELIGIEAKFDKAHKIVFRYDNDTEKVLTQKLFIEKAEADARKVIKAKDVDKETDKTIKEEVDRISKDKSILDDKIKENLITKIETNRDEIKKRVLNRMVSVKKIEIGTNSFTQLIKDIKEECKKFSDAFLNL